MRTEPKPATGEKDSPELAYNRGYDAGWEAHKARCYEMRKSYEAELASVKDKGVTFCVTLDRRITELEQQLSTAREAWRKVRHELEAYDSTWFRHNITLIEPLDAELDNI
jgi:hypothetical protein